MTFETLFSFLERLPRWCVDIRNIEGISVNVIGRRDSILDFHESYYEACKAHGYEGIRYILSPARRLMIQKFLDTNESERLQRSYFYRELYDFFTIGEEGMKKKTKQKRIFWYFTSSLPRSWLWRDRIS